MDSPKQVIWVSCHSIYSIVGGSTIRPVCRSLTWDLRWSFRVDRYGQCSHAKGFSPVCVRMWAFNFSFWAAEYGQKGHVKGFSPVWILKCVLRLALWTALKGQCGQANGFSPVWVATWISIWLRDEVVYPQQGQRIMLAPPTPPTCRGVRLI